MNNNGSIVIMSSTDSNFGGKITSAYAASKAGINSLVKSLALQLSDKNINVNCIALGWYDAGMATDNDLLEYAKKINPQNKNADVSDVSELLMFLSSNGGKYINGQTITLGGGYTLQYPTLIFEENNKLNNN